MEYISDDPEGLLNSSDMFDAQRRVLHFAGKMFRSLEDEDHALTASSRLFLQHAEEHHIDARLCNAEDRLKDDDFVSEIIFYIRGYLRETAEDNPGIGKADEESVIKKVTVALNSYASKTVFDQMTPAESEAVVRYAYAVQKREWEKEAANADQTLARRLLCLQKRLDQLEEHFREEIFKIQYDRYSE